MKRLLSAALATVCVLLLFPVAAYAAVDSRPSNLTVVMKYGDTALEGIGVAVCLAAGAKEAGDGIVYTATEAFAGAGADFTILTKERNIALAARLDTYASARNIPRSSKATDSEGKAVFTGLAAGLYLVAQKDAENSEYVIAPYLVMVPGLDERTREWDTDVTAYPKTEPVKRNVKTEVLSVYKVWAGVDSPPPGESILVQLYRGGVPYGNCVTLNAGNRWSYTWEGLDPKDVWTVDEFDVPEGYAKKIAGSASSGFVVTNTRDQNAPKKTLVSGSKTWDHGANPAANRPKSIVLRLSADGVFILQKEITEAEHWSWSLRLDEYAADGHKIAYTVDEAPVDGYTKAVDGYSITNTHYSAHKPGGPGTTAPGGSDKPGATNPKTNDLNNLALWLTLMALSFVGLVVIILCFRRHMRHEKNLI